jgi:hypothetical protein
MNPPAPGAASNSGFILGEPIIGGGVAVVLRSDDERLKPGDKFWEAWGLRESHNQSLLIEWTVQGDYPSTPRVLDSERISVGQYQTY